MVELSQQAADALLESLQASGVGPDKGLRLQEQGGDFTLAVDDATEQDRVIEHKESKVLIVDNQTDEMLADAVIDIAQGPQGSYLTIRRQE